MSNECRLKSVQVLDFPDHHFTLLNSQFTAVWIRLTPIWFHCNYPTQCSSNFRIWSLDIFSLKPASPQNRFTTFDLPVYLAAHSITLMMNLAPYFVTTRYFTNIFIIFGDTIIITLSPVESFQFVHLIWLPTRFFSAPAGSSKLSYLIKWKVSVFLFYLNIGFLAFQ